MASDDTMNTIQSSLQDFEDYYDIHHNPNHHNLSRLSLCTNSCNNDIENLASVCMSNLSIESYQVDGGDAEFSADGKDDPLLKTGLLSSGSENESGSCYSLPTTPPRQRNLIPLPLAVKVKDYASENEARKETKRSDSRRRRRRRSVFSGESDGNGVIVITRPKGGNRSLCMDLEEVKACRDLGFELEHERISSLSFSNSTTLDNTTSSGGNSPISNWRISGPGDDPRDVKARLKVWAQAVAIASATKFGS